MRVYYLCPPHVAVSNIALRRLKISRFSDLNDPFELLAVDLADKGHRAVFRKMKESLTENNGLLCFARSWNNPLMWGHYAERHAGMALGFEIDESLLKPVIYAKRPMKIEIDVRTGKPTLTAEAMERLLRTKFHDWKYEDELRLFVGLDHGTQESGMYFYPFDSRLTLREVIVGPRCELPLENLRQLVGSYDHPVTIMKSRIAFSSFRVIKDRTASR